MQFSQYVQSFNSRASQHSLLIWAFAASMFMAWLIPSHSLPWTPFYSDFIAFVALSFVLLHISLSSRSGGISAPKAAIFLGATCIIPLLQTWAGMIPFYGDAWISSLYIAGFTLAYISGFHTGRQPSTDIYTTLAWTFLFGALVSGYCSLYQFLRQDSGIWIIDAAPGLPPHGNLGQRTNLSTLYFLGIASLIFLRGKNSLSGLTSGFLTLLLITALAMSQQRTPVLQGLFLVAWWLFHGRQHSGLHWAPIAVFTGIYFLLVKNWQHILEFLNFGSETFLGRGYNPGGRDVIWTQFLDAVSREPLTGYGWLQAAKAHLLVSSDYPTLATIQSSHNFFLDLLVWTGIPLGGLITLGICWWLITRAIRCNSSTGWFAILCIGLIMTQAMVDPALDYAYFLIPMGILAGRMEADSPSIATFKIPNVFTWLVLVASISFISLIYSEYQKVEKDHLLMRFESANYAVPRPGHNAPDILLLDQLREFLHFTRTEARENMPEEELDWMKNVSRRYPFPPVLFRYTLALGINNLPQTASQEMLRIGKIHPYHYEVGVSDLKHLANSRYSQLNAVLDILAKEEAMTATSEISGN